MYNLNLLLEIKYSGEDKFKLFISALITIINLFIIINSLVYFKLYIFKIILNFVNLIFTKRIR